MEAWLRRKRSATRPEIRYFPIFPTGGNEMYALPKLPYPANALEPYYDAATLEIHHGKHHQAYVDKLNKALESAPELSGKPIEQLLANLEALERTLGRRPDLLARARLSTEDREMLNDIRSARAERASEGGGRG
jgi:hypothetical protein